MMLNFVCVCILYYKGRLAQLARALALQARCHRFESYIAHHIHLQHFEYSLELYNR